MPKKATFALDIVAALLGRGCGIAPNHRELLRMSGWDWSHSRLFFCISLQA